MPANQVNSQRQKYLCLPKTILGISAALCLTQSMNIKFENFFFPLSTSSMTNPSLSVHRLCQSRKKLNNALKSECEHESAANIINQYTAMQ